MEANDVFFNSSNFTNLCMYYYFFSDGFYVLGRLTGPRELNYIKPLSDIGHCAGCFMYTPHPLFQTSQEVDFLFSM